MFACRLTLILQNMLKRQQLIWSVMEPRNGGPVRLNTEYANMHTKIINNEDLFLLEINKISSYEN